MGQKFMPNETFTAEVNGHTNTYRRGQQYIVYDTPDHQDLANKVAEWVNQGKVTITGMTPNAARPVNVTTQG